MCRDLNRSHLILVQTWPELTSSPTNDLLLCSRPVQHHNRDHLGVEDYCKKDGKGYLWLYSLPGAFVHSTFFSKTLFPVCLHWSELSKWMRKVKLRLDHLWVKESEEFFCSASDRLIKQQSKFHALKMYIVYIFCCCKNLSVIHSEIIRDNSRFMSGKLFIASAGDIFQ